MSKELPLPPGYEYTGNLWQHSPPTVAARFSVVAEPSPLDDDILLQQAYLSGYDEGYRDGHLAGYKVGHGDTL